MSGSATVTDRAELGAQGQREGSRWTGIVGTIIVVLALTSALATFLVLAGMVPVPPTHEVVLRLFLVNAVLIVALLGFVVRETVRLLRARRAGLAASGLHARIVSLFAWTSSSAATFAACSRRRSMWPTPIGSCSAGPSAAR